MQAEVHGKAVVVLGRPLGGRGVGIVALAGRARVVRHRQATVRVGVG